MTNSVTSENSASRSNLALAVAGVGFVIWLVAFFVAGDEGDGNQWMWPVAGVLGFAGAVMGWMAGKPRPAGRALAAVVLGGITAVAILGWIVWAAATGNM